MFSVCIDKEDNLYFTYLYIVAPGIGRRGLVSFDNLGISRWTKELKPYEPGHYFSVYSPLLSKDGLIITAGGQGDGQFIFFRGLMAFNIEGDSVFSFTLDHNGYPQEDTYRLTKDSHDNIYYYLNRTTGSSGFNSLGAIDIKGNSIFETQSTPGFDAISPEGGYITTFRSNLEYFLQFRK